MSRLGSMLPGRKLELNLILVPRTFAHRPENAVQFRTLACLRQHSLVCSLQIRGPDWRGALPLRNKHTSRHRPWRTRRLRLGPKRSTAPRHTGIRRRGHRRVGRSRNHLLYAWWIGFL